MSISVPVIVRRSLYIVINVSSLQHLGEIGRHPIKNKPCLSVRIDVFGAGPGDSRSATHQLRY